MTHSLVIIASSICLYFSCLRKSFSPLFDLIKASLFSWAIQLTTGTAHNSAGTQIKSNLPLFSFCLLLNKTQHHRSFGFFLLVPQNIFPVPIITLQLGKRKNRRKKYRWPFWLNSHLYNTWIAKEYRIFSGYLIIGASIHCRGPHAYTHKHDILHVCTYAHVQV